MPKRTYSPNKSKRAKTHGFRARMQTKSGVKIIKSRRHKGRSELAATPSN